MCDYSLELYNSRPARAGEKLQTFRFGTGSIGMTAPGEPTCAVCITDGTVLAVRGMPEPMRARYGLGEVEAATFVRLTTGVYRDGLRFENGVELSLQQLMPLLEVTVAALPEIRPASLQAARGVIEA